MRPLELLSWLRPLHTNSQFLKLFQTTMWYAHQAAESAFYLPHLVSFMTQLHYHLHQYHTGHSHIIHTCTSSHLYSLKTETWESNLTPPISVHTSSSAIATLPTGPSHPTPSVGPHLCSPHPALVYSPTSYLVSLFHPLIHFPNSSQNETFKTQVHYIQPWIKTLQWLPTALTDKNDCLADKALHLLPNKLSTGFLSLSHYCLCSSHTGLSAP